MKHRSWLIAVAMSVQACTSLAPAPTRPAPNAPANTEAAVAQPGATASPSAATSPSAAAASAASIMLAEAQTQRAAGALTNAESTIERALRIEPNDPWLWIELGEIKLQSGDAQQAGAMARKALTLAGGDREIERRANRLLGAR